MNKGTVSVRVLVFALLGTLLIRFLAWSATGSETIHAGHRNQTIPTITPSDLPVTPTTTEPTEPPVTGEPTSPPVEPSDTPVPAQSPSPLPTSTRQPTDGPAAPTLTVATAAPTGDAGTPLPPVPATPTSAPTRALPTGSPSYTPVASSPSVTPEATPNRLEQHTPVSVPATTSAIPTPTPAVSDPGAPGTMLRSSSCLWIGLGLILIVAGLVVLIRWRRSI